FLCFLVVFSRYDFTLCYVLLLILGLDLLMFVVFSSFYYSHMADVGYGSLGALLFSLMMTGSMSHRVKRSSTPPLHLLFISSNQRRVCV
uniref:Uncharacterized protein n=1 Tax=Periophthalmus magnuspinnatus TaxID=409849 RepID=A0A3B3ZE16_9GOBI